MRRSALLVSLVVASCSAPPDLARERAAILAADSAWLAAAHAGNTDSTLTFWTTDARIISPGQPSLIGRDAIRRMLVESAAIPGFSVTWNTTDVVVAPSGDVAYSFGTNAVTVPGPDGRPDTLRGQGVVVWRKGTDGRWRSVVDTWTPQPPPSTPARGGVQPN